MKTRPPSIALGAVGLILLALVGCASKSDRTSLVVRVESDLAVGIEIDTVVVEGHAVPLASPSDLPVVIAFTPSGASNAAIAVTAIARWKGTDVVQQSITTAFQPGAAVLVAMHLDHTCIAKTCDTDQTCEAGTCGPKGRTPTPYPGANDAGNPRVDALQSTDAAEAGANDASADGNAPAIDGSPETGAAAPPDAQDAGAPDIRDSGAPDVPTMICGDGVISGTEICDDFNASACGTCNASCTSPQTLMPAIGSIIAVQASNTLDGETFTLADGVHAPVVFEFNDNVVAAGHVQIFRAASVSSQMAIKMAFAINSVGTTLQINAVVGTNKSQVLLTDINAGASGNIGITETVANGSFMITGMTGGTGRDCVLRVGCGSNDDCQSGSCCIGAMGSATCPCPSGTCATNTCVAAGP